MAFFDGALGAPPIFFLPVILFFAKTAGGQGLGDECWGLGMCNSWMFDCINYVCSCRSGYVTSADNTACVIGIDEPCLTYSDVCYDSNAFCDEEASLRCVCNKNYTRHTETKLCYRDLGTECGADDTPCFDGSCVDGICQCVEGLSGNQYRSKCGTAVGGSCGSGVADCVDPNAVCNTVKICECEGDYQRAVDASGTTVCKKRLGAGCASTVECGPENSTCETMLNRKGACNCNVGRVPSGERKSCLKVADHWEGACQEDAQCIAGFGRHSYCRSNACSCVNGYTYSSEDFACVIEPR